MNMLLEPETENINDILTTQNTSQNSNIPVFIHNTRLPRIEIPKFNGSADWLSFKDLNEFSHFIQSDSYICRETSISQNEFSRFSFTFIKKYYAYRR